MNSSIYSVDRATHLRVFAIALAISIAIVGVAPTARIGSFHAVDAAMDSGRAQKANSATRKRQRHATILHGVEAKRPTVRPLPYRSNQDLPSPVQTTCRRMPRVSTARHSTIHSRRTRERFAMRKSRIAPLGAVMTAYVTSNDAPVPLPANSRD